MNKTPSLSDIPEEERTPTVRLLLTIIEQQQEIIVKQQEQIEALNEEVARLKKLPKKPNIRPSTLPKDDDSDEDDDDNSGHNGNNNSIRKSTKRRGHKRKKNLTIHKTKVINPSSLPDGSRLLGYQNYTVQDLLIQPFNTCYRLARYRTPSGKILIGKLANEIQGSHFGSSLKTYILYQAYHQRVTQPLIKKQLNEWGVAISSGQISKILIEDKECFHTEKNVLLTAGVNNSTYIHVDDTGSRHEGKNGYCTHIGNESFAWFSSTRYKSRINFLQLLRGAAIDYTINAVAIDYMRAEGLPHTPLTSIERAQSVTLNDEKAWRNYLQQINITKKRHIRIATEGALLGTLIANGFPMELAIMSDDAGQFNILLHALCWIHADRVFQRILPLNDTHAKELNWVHTQIWDIYFSLKQYKKHPNSEMKAIIEAHFDELCRTKTTFATLNQAIKRLAKNKKELLLVLKRPDIPLHNNLSERDIREYVIKRKISGSTRSENGRRCRDTFASLKKTCSKQKISFWDFISDRVRNWNLIPYLPDLLTGNACIVPGV